MSLVLNLKRGDTAPKFRARCLDGTAPVDLTAATQIRLLMRRFAGGAAVLAATMTVEDQATSPGWVHYTWAAEDLATAGLYRAEVEVTWPDSTVQTFPPHTYVTINIVADLA